MSNMLVNWDSILRPQIIKRKEKTKIETFSCTCGNRTCMRAKNHKCVCSCGGVNHAIIFKEKNKLSSLDDYSVENPLNPDPFLFYAISVGASLKLNVSSKFV